MKTVEPSRVVFVSSLVVLGVSVGVFVVATGVVSPLTAGTVAEFAIEDETLVVTDDGRSRTVVTDVSAVDRIEIRSVGGRLLAHTEPRNLPTVSVSQRSQAKRIVTTREPIADSIGTAGGVVYTMRPVPDGVASDRAAVLGADSETTWERLMSRDGSAFVAQTNDTAGRLVLQRKPRARPDRVLVVVHPMDSRVRYSVVVDLRKKTIESFVRFDPATT